MQIISGKYKHSPLKSPNDEKTHPMGNREKLALFNILNDKIEEKTVLDAFAGTGALGLEALSRGAKSVTFVEKSPKAAKILKENIENTLKSEKNAAKIIIKDLKSYKTEEKFDLIFADPPYDLYNEALIAPLSLLLNKSGILAVSLPKTAKAPFLNGLEAFSRREYASCALIFFQKTD